MRNPSKHIKQLTTPGQGLTSHLAVAGGHYRMTHWAAGGACSGHFQDVMVHDLEDAKENGVNVVVHTLILNLG